MHGVRLRMGEMMELMAKRIFQALRLQVTVSLFGLSMWRSLSRDVRRVSAKNRSLSREIIGATLLSAMKHFEDTLESRIETPAFTTPRLPKRERGAAAA
jgi:hypothetical protein